jgi:hypothetical protein
VTTVLPIVEMTSTGDAGCGVELSTDRSRRRLVDAALLAVVAGVLTAAILNSEPLQSANDKSRWSTIWSLVERRTWQIDEIDARPDWTTIDKVRHEGHFYSSKPPLLTALYAGVYSLIKGVTGWTLPGDVVAVSRTMLFFTHLVPWLMALWLLMRIADRFIQAEYARVLFVLTAAFGTLITAFIPTLNNHSVAAVSLIFSLYSAIRVLDAGVHTASASDDSTAPIADSGGSSTAAVWTHAMFSGFFAGFTYTCELPSALYGAILFLVMLRANWRVTLFAFVPAALIPMGASVALNVAVTGGIKPFYAYYGTEKYVYEIDGVPSYWSNPTGTDRVVDSPLVYLMHCTIGHHGILSLSPIWLLSIAGWCLMRRAKDRTLRTLLAMGPILTIVVLGFYLTRTENYNYGGHSAGLRWMLWITPFWLLALIPAAELWSGCRYFRTVSLALLAVSVYSAHANLDNPWRQPWLFARMQGWGFLKQYNRLPGKPLPHALHTWFGSIPASKDGEPAWIELAGNDPFGRTVTWRLTREHDREPGRPSIRFTRSVSGESAREVLFVIDRKAFESGEPPERFLVEPVDQQKRDALIPLLTGLPTARAYNSGTVRYLRTPARQRAFTCQPAASRVVETSAEGRRISWQTNLMLCPELPFGIARVDSVANDVSTGDVLSQQRMVVRDYHPKTEPVSEVDARLDP